MPEVVSRTIDNVVILVHSANPPTDTEWNEIIELQRNNPSDKTLVVSAGGGPTNPQRMRMKEAIKGKQDNPMVAVVTESRVVRGIVKAMSWFNPGIRSFNPDQLGDALTYLDIDEAKRALFLRTVERMQGEIGARADGV